jgi:hypothetical protein
MCTDLMMPGGFNWRPEVMGRGQVFRRPMTHHPEISKIIFTFLEKYLHRRKQKKLPESILPGLLRCHL